MKSNSASSFDDADDAGNNNSSPFASNPNLEDDVQNVEYHQQSTVGAALAPTWVRNSINREPNPSASGAAVAGRQNDDSANGFVFVTRPLQSVRLKDPWASGERLPGVNSSASMNNQTISKSAPATHTTLPVTQIRRRLIDSSGSTSSSSPTAKHDGASVPGSHGLFDVEVYTDGETGVEHSVITPGAAFLNLYDHETNEFVLVIEQKSFYHDVLASFSTADEIKSAQAERYHLRALQEELNRRKSAPRGWFSWRSIPPIPNEPNVDHHFAVGECPGGIKEESTTPLTPGEMLTESRTFDKSVMKMSAGGDDGAVPTLSQMQWEKVWKQFKCDIGRENFCIQSRRVVDPDAAISDLTELFQLFATDLRDYVRKEESARQQKSSGGSSLGGGLGNLWYALAYPAELASWGLKVTGFRPWQQQAALPVASDAETKQPLTGAASADSEDASTALAGALSRMVVLLSQQSVLALPYELFVRQFVDSDQLTGSSIYVGETKYEEKCQNEALKGGMKVNVQRAPAYQAYCEARDAASSTEGGAISAPPALESRPSIYITIEKEFRVFSIPHDDVEDRTLFHISSQISFCITDSGDVVQLRWVLTPPPSLAGGASPSHSERTASSSARQAALLTGEEELTPPHLPRQCDCLGATSGFHRSSCLLRQ